MEMNLYKSTKYQFEKLGGKIEEGITLNRIQVNLLQVYIELIS